MPPRLQRYTLAVGDGGVFYDQVRGLLVERLDVDGLARGTPITVWMVESEEQRALVAVVIERAMVDGEPLALVRATVDDIAVCLARSGSALLPCESFIDQDGYTVDGTVLSRPVDYRMITSSIGMREHPLWKRQRFHSGTDYGAPIGTPVVAIADGEVVRSRWGRGSGRFVVIRHTDGRVSKYLHLHRMFVKEGSFVSRGQVIGSVGKSGAVTGPHLHFEVHDRRRVPVDHAHRAYPGAARVQGPALTEAGLRLRVLLTGDADRLGKEREERGLAKLPLPPDVQTPALDLEHVLFPSTRRSLRARNGPRRARAVA